MDVTIEIHNHRNHEMVEEYARERIENQLGKFPFITTCQVQIGRDDNEGYVAKVETHVKSGAPTFAHAEDVSENKALNAALLKTVRQLKKYKDKHYQDHSIVS